MKKFLIAGSSLAAVAAAGSAGAVDVTLGGSIDMGVEYGVGKAAGEFAIGDAYNKVSLKISAAGTTDGGLKYGGSFGLGTDAELSFAPYENGGKKYLVKATQSGPTDIIGNIRAVSGGATVGGASGGDIVAVKINSAWASVGGTQTAYKYQSSGNFQSTNICKLAGQANESFPPTVANANTSFGAMRASAGGAITDVLQIETGYLPAGRLGAAGTDASWSVAAGGAGFAVADALTVAGVGVKRTITADEVVAAAAANKAGAIAIGKFDITVKPSIPEVTKNAESNLGKSTPYQPQVTYVVSSAAVYLGPFMEVQLASSTTKMVVGAVCVAGIEASETVYHMNNKSKVVTATDASIYIEGGFGKLTLQTGDYAGAVSAIGGAGDVAGIDADGLVVVASGLGMMGANPYLAMDLAAGSSVGAIEMAAGGSINFAGMSGAMDIQLADGGLASVIGTEISGWDLGLTYQMGDLALAFATDSENDWGLSASMDVAGFGVDAVFSSEGTGDHEKSGIMYSVTASTSLNGFGLSIGVDQGLEPTVGLSYSLGALSLYAGYDASETGGTAGAKLSF
jgi:hypothetical protein